MLGRKDSTLPLRQTEYCLRAAALPTKHNNDVGKEKLVVEVQHGGG
jgi:hypothetical protein